MPGLGVLGAEPEGDSRYPNGMKLLFYLRKKEKMAKHTNATG